MKYIKLIGVFLLSLVISVACVKWEEEPTYTVDAASSVAIDLVSVGDSAFTISVANTKDGFVGVNLMPGTGNELPAELADKEAFLTGNVENMDYTSVKTMVGEPGSVTFAGLVQNTTYEVIAVANNADGVVSEGVLFTVTTTDSWAPVFAGSDPEPTRDAIIEQMAPITLVFDEPVAVDDSKPFVFSTMFSGIAEAATAVAVGNTVVVTPASAFPEGDYLFLSWPEGAVTDLSGNMADSMASYYDAGFYGQYYRMVRPPRSPVSVGPAADSIAHGAPLVITYDDAVAPDFYFTQGMIELHYHYYIINSYDEQVWMERTPTYVAVEDLVFDGVTVSIPQSSTEAMVGDLLEVIVAEEAFDIGFYVPNAEIEAGFWRLH